MEPKLLISSSKPFQGTAQLPFLLSYNNSPFLVKPRISKLTERTQFLGQTLGFPEKNGVLGNVRNTRVPFHRIRAAVKRIKELPFDNVIQKDKKLKLVTKVRNILVSQPDRIMSIRDLGKFRRQLGLKRNRRFISLLRKFPAVFEIMQEGVYSLQFKLTPEAERLYLEELKYRDEIEDLLVIKLRKLLMMSWEKRILLERIAHLRTDLGLPLEFRETICRNYPQYFKVVRTWAGPALELTHWDPELAVSAAEISEEKTRASPHKFKKVTLPKRLHLSRRISQFRDMPYISPYSDFSELRSGTLEKEKHACGAVHEILSLTVEKRTLVDYLTHFREELRFSNQLRGMLIRHPDMFYVSLKGERDSVFLREAYRGSQLVEKDRLLLIKEKLRSLVSVPRSPWKGPPTRCDVDGVEATEEQRDADDDDGNDDDDKDEDDWSGEEDESPPDFYEDDGIVKVGLDKPMKKVDNLWIHGEDVRVPVLPDGRLREHW